MLDSLKQFLATLALLGGVFFIFAVAIWGLETVLLWIGEQLRFIRTDIEQ